MEKTWAGFILRPAAVSVSSRLPGLGKVVQQLGAGTIERRWLEHTKSWELLPVPGQENECWGLGWRHSKLE